MSLLNLLRRLQLDRLFFTLMYWRGRPPWDTGVVPPEVVAAIEGLDALPPGRSLDLGCGTGTNSLYLARHGWQATGIDFAAPAIAQANAKLKRADKLAGSAQFLRGDVTQLGALGVVGPFTLVLDLGCFHGVAPERRAAYADGVTRVTAPGALFLLYAFGPRQLPGGRPAGISPDGVRTCFEPAFRVEHMEEGTDTSRGFSSAWYWLRRV